MDTRMGGTRALQMTRSSLEGVCTGGGKRVRARDSRTEAEYGSSSAQTPRLFRGRTRCRHQPCDRNRGNRVFLQTDSRAICSHSFDRLAALWESRWGRLRNKEHRCAAHSSTTGERGNLCGRRGGVRGLLEAFPASQVSGVALLDGNSPAENG